MKKIFGEDSELLGGIALERYIYSSIPMDIQKEDDKKEISSFFMTKGEFIRSLRKLVLSKSSLYEIAILSITLIKSYIDFKDNYFEMNNWNSERILEYQNIKKYLKKVNNIMNFNDDTYKKDLCNLMILSYFYTTGTIDVYKNKLDDYLESLNNNKVKTGSRLYTNVIYNYTSRNQNKDKKRYLLPTYFNEDFKINNIFDIEIILSLLKHPTKKKNPFYHEEITELDIIFDTNTDIMNFFKVLKDISLNNDHKNQHILELFNILKDNRFKEPLLKDDYFKEPLLKNDLFIEKPEMIYVYNQFILERILNINFINKLFKLKNKVKMTLIDNLKDLIVCPLLNTRMKLLSMIMEDDKLLSYLNDNFREHYFERNIQNLIEHQNKCVIPLAITIFHYLMTFKIKDIHCKLSKEKEIFLKEEYNNKNDKNEDFETFSNNFGKKEKEKKKWEKQKKEQIQVYLEQLKNSYFEDYLEENTFFIFNKKTNSVEAKMESISVGDNISEYNHFVNKQILNFEKLSIKYSQYSFKECLDSAVQDIPEFLKQKIVDISHSDEGINTD